MKVRGRINILTPSVRLRLIITLLKIIKGKRAGIKALYHRSRPSSAPFAIISGFVKDNRRTIKLKHYEIYYET